MNARRHALARLEQADRRLAASQGPLRSLAPDRAVARGAAEICAALFDDDAPAELVVSFAEGTEAWRDAIAAAFPDNLLWDCDLALSTWWRRARADVAPAATARALLQAACAAAAVQSPRRVGLPLRPRLPVRLRLGQVGRTRARAARA
ncbi:MAG: hypothetical protein U0168_31300 [Nannocystaceae bacterium]